MSFESLLDIFQGVHTLLSSSTGMAIARISLIFLGILFVYLGKKGTLEPLLMIPMGLGMATVNAAVMYFDPTNPMHATTHVFGNLFVAPEISDTTQLMNILQIDFLQPIYTFTFSNGLIACLVFMGIGSLLDVGFVMQRPFMSMFLALFAELGSIVTLPIAKAFGLTMGQSASIAIVGGADGPMVLFTSLKLAPELFVPITVVAYLYLGLAYGAFPYLAKLMIPKKLRGIAMTPPKNEKKISSGQKLAFAIICCVVLSFLFPVAAPLFLSLFVGIAVRESGIKAFQDLISNQILYGATFFLGFLLGILCDANTILSPKVLPLLLLGMLSLLLSGIGGIIGGYILWFFSRGKFNPVIGIAGVSCVPSTAKVAQKVVSSANPNAIIMQYALGANICGVITTAIIAAIYVSMLAGK
jgi:carboxybiotin decarboxylase